MESFMIFVVLCVKYGIAWCSSIDYLPGQEEYALMPPEFEMDDYDRCMQMESEALYCYGKIQLSPLRHYNVSKVWRLIEYYSAIPKNYRHDQLRRGICLSQSCSNFNSTLRNSYNNNELMRKVVAQCYNEVLKKYDLQGVVIKLHCETVQPVYEVDELDLFVGVSLLTLILLVLIATFYEGSARYKSPDEYEKIFSNLGAKLIACFSLAKNWYRLTGVNKTPEAKALSAIQGVRFFNTFALIFGHSVMSTFALPVSNTIYVEEATDKFINTLVNNGVLVVQTFLLISGILLSYYFFLTMETCKNVNVGFAFMAVVHRYIRLTPCLLVMIGMQATWVYHAGRGPLWDWVMGTDYRRCRANWWTNLLYMNNYVNADEPCLHHTWYLAADMQLFVVTLIMLMVMWRYRTYFKIILISSIIVAMVIPGVISYIYDYDIVFRPYPELVENYFLNSEQYYRIHIPGYSNMGTYLIGAAFGYLIYTYRGNTKLSESTRLTVIWWIVTWFLPLCMILIGAIAYQSWYSHSRIFAALYAALGKNIFSFGIGVGIFGSTIGFGWYPRWLVQWKLFRIIGRLTYCAYICHFTLMRMRLGSMRSPPFNNDFLVFYQTMADAAVAYSVAAMLCLFVELPVSALQKIMLSHLKKLQQSKQYVNEIPVLIKGKVQTESTQTDNMLSTLIILRTAEDNQTCTL